MQPTPALTSPPLAGCPVPVALLRESDLHTLWLDQRFPAGALATVAGDPIRVLYRGRPGNGPGPDFRDARISIGGGAPHLGDVELHVTEPDFRRHGHDHDPAYRRVVLHVVFDAAGAGETSLPGGGTAPLLALRPWVDRRSAELSAWLERSHPWREPCFTAVSRLGRHHVQSVLTDGGRRRLHDKAAALTGDGETPSEQDLYRAVCSALGLTRNVEPFRMLAGRVPLATLRAETDGLPEDEAAALLRRRLRTAAGFGPDPPLLSNLPWRLNGLRPTAHPAKRIDGLAAILARHRGSGLERALRQAAQSGAPALLRALQAPGIGRNRAVEVAVNAVIPYLIASGDEAAALALAERLPAAAPYGPLTTLTAALIDEVDSGRAARPLPMAGALAQQGALALHRDWCRRGGCGVCPLS